LALLQCALLLLTAVSSSVGQPLARRGPVTFRRSNQELLPQPLPPPPLQAAPSDAPRQQQQPQQPVAASGSSRMPPQDQTVQAMAGAQPVQQPALQQPQQPLPCSLWDVLSRYQNASVYLQAAQATGIAE